jgi:hypothetical protein
VARQFASTPTGWRRRLRLVAFHSLITAYLIFTLTANLFYRRTGSMLDAGTLLVASSAPGVAADAIRRSATVTHEVLLLLVIGYGAVGPFLVGWLARTIRGRTNSRVRHGVSAGPAARRSRRFTHVLTSGVAMLTLVIGSAVPMVTGSGSFARNRAVDITLELLGPSGRRLRPAHRIGRRPPPPAWFTTRAGSPARSPSLATWW